MVDIGIVCTRLSSGPAGGDVPALCRAVVGNHLPGAAINRSRLHRVVEIPGLNKVSSNNRPSHSGGLHHAMTSTASSMDSMIVIVELSVMIGARVTAPHSFVRSATNSNLCCWELSLSLCSNRAFPSTSSLIHS